MNFRLNRIIKLQAVLTILLTIPMIVSGLYGMNVDLPLQNEGSAFAIIVIGTVLVDVFVLFAMWKRKIL